MSIIYLAILIVSSVYRNKSVITIQVIALLYNYKRGMCVTLNVSADTQKYINAIFNTIESEVYTVQ